MKKIYLLIFSLSISATYQAQDLSKIMTVSPGATVIVEEGTTIYASNVNLKSTSDKFACLYLDGDLGTSTVVNYDRYVSAQGVSGENGGNDLVSMPVKGLVDVTFPDFLNFSADEGITKNSNILPESVSTPGRFLFGPYNNPTQTYINYDTTTNATTVLETAKGYRAATRGGKTLRFSGTVSKDIETITITTNGNNYFNLIGNPFPTYIDSQAFLTENSDKLDPSAKAIYGYNSGTLQSETGTIGNFTIINNLTNTDLNIAPGQGFLVANKKTGAPSQIITFTQGMRTTIGTDDFIVGRSTTTNQMLRLRVDQPAANFATEIYFNENSTLGLDPGYDAELFSGANSNLMIYSKLVENNTGRNMAIQSLGFNALDEVVIPLGVKVAQGKQVTFSIERSTLTEGTDVYLEDNVTNTFTLLNSADYTFTANTAILGSGRFFLRFGTSTLSNTEQNSNNLKLYANDHNIHINGLLLADTKVSVYDIQGRLVLTSLFQEGSTTNTIDATSFSSGVYLVKLFNETQTLTKKVIIK